MLWYRKDAFRQHDHSCRACLYEYPECSVMYDMTSIVETDDTTASFKCSIIRGSDDDKTLWMYNVHGSFIGVVHRDDYVFEGLQGQDTELLLYDVTIQNITEAAQSLLGVGDDWNIHPLTADVVAHVVRKAQCECARTVALGLTHSLPPLVRQIVASNCIPDCVVCLEPVDPAASRCFEYSGDDDAFEVDAHALVDECYAELSDQPQ